MFSSWQDSCRQSSSTSPGASQALVNSVAHPSLSLFTFREPTYGASAEAASAIHGQGEEQQASVAAPRVREDEAVDGEAGIPVKPKAGKFDFSGLSLWN